jgi:hypothetical protein
MEIARIFVPFDKEVLDGQKMHQENDRIELDIISEGKNCHNGGLLWKEKGTSVEGNNLKKRRRRNKT